MAMRVPATDYEMRRPDPGVTEEEFCSRADIREGISGRDRFDSNFENTERGQVLAPRGDAVGRPMPRDARFREADNHGEWGSDQFRERLEYGMDGPDESRPMHGQGLPRRMDLSSPVNTVSLSEIGIAPTAEGIDGDN